MKELLVFQCWHSYVQVESLPAPFLLARETFIVFCILFHCCIEVDILYSPEIYDFV